MATIELKLGEGGEKVVEVEYDEDKNEVIETFSHFMIRLEAELKMESKNDWKKVIFRKKGEVKWQPFLVPKRK